MCIHIYIYIHVSLFMCLKGTEKVMMIGQDVIEGMGTEHDANGIE